MAENFIRSNVMMPRELWSGTPPSEDASQAKAATAGLQAGISPEKPLTEKERADYMAGARWLLDQKIRTEEDAWIAAVAGKSKK